MLGTVASVLIYVEKRRLFEVIPDDIRKLWKDWEVRILIVVSLILQIVLILLGNQRKYKGRNRIRITIWCAYLLADSLATIALGVIAQNTLGNECKKSPDEKSKDQLMSFWAPFLLLHLGGPDTITAYALEDNELWLRHFAGLVIHSVLVIYVLLVALPGPSWFCFSSALILVAGLVKYFERTMALRSANFENLRNSMLTLPDPGPNYPKFMEEFTLKKAEGFYVEANEVKELPVRTPHLYPPGRGRLISEAYDQFETFKRLFVDLILSFHDRDHSQSYFQKLQPKEAFDVIEIELGFAFDMFFTKAPIVYTFAGCVLRVITFSFTCISLILFSLLYENDRYEAPDLVISYLLLVGAIVLELYAATVLLNSDWIGHWLSKRNQTRDSLISSCLQQSEKPRWANSIAQCNLLGFCLEYKPMFCYKLQQLFQIADFLENRRFKTYEMISDDLKTLIFTRFKKFAGTNDPTALCTRRGSFTLRENDRSSLNWTTNVEFDQSILIWHIATDLCYYSDWGENLEKASTNSKESKHISDYMLYLLIMCPFMLPIGIGMIRFRDTRAEAKEFFEERNLGNNKVDACRRLLHVNTEVLPAKVKGDRSKSVLFDACRLAKSLQAFEKDDKWEIISHMWVEMLAYAATHCRGNHHAQQLRKGGQFLSHVWLLMAHLGITEQFQISQGHARAKLSAK